MIKIGVLGAGHLGSIHIKLLKEISDLGGDISSFVPTTVLKAIERKKNHKKV